MNIIIDGKCCSAEYGEYILDVAKRNDIKIPTLCHSDALPGQANCRLCMVEVTEGKRKRIVASCIYPITREIEVAVNSEKVVQIRRTLISLLWAMAPKDERIKELMIEYGVKAPDRFRTDPDQKCILCGLCVRACHEVGSNSISMVNRGITKKVSTPYEEPSAECIGCGACAEVCHTGAIDMHDYEGIRTIWNKEFRLVKCARCGEYYATGEQIKYIGDKLGTCDKLDLCSKCRRKEASESLMDIFAL